MVCHYARPYKPYLLHFNHLVAQKMQLCVSMMIDVLTINYQYYIWYTAESWKDGSLFLAVLNVTVHKSIANVSALIWHHDYQPLVQVDQLVQCVYAC